MAQLSIKKALAKVLQWMKSPRVISNVANSEPFYLSERTDTGVKVGFGVGSGGINHGVYSFKLAKWLIYGDASTVYVNGVQMRKTAVTVTKSGSAWTSGTIQAWYNSGTVTIQFANVSIGTISTRTTVATIPAGYRPPTEMYGKFSNSAYTTPIYVTASGEIRVESAMSGKTGVYGCVTYIAWQ